jgi:hypothetical protein
MPGWVIPVVVIVVTGWLGRDGEHVPLVCFWLGGVSAVVAYVLTKISFDPETYARPLGGALAVVVGLTVTQLLLHGAGYSLLSPR